MKNKYEIRGDVTAIFISSPKYGMHEVLISTKKLPLMHEYHRSWRVLWNRTTKSFYVYGMLNVGKNKDITIALHRYLTDAPKGMVVDHINHKTLDNTDENLRVISQTENMQNRRGARRNSMSGVRGVAWNRTGWIARIVVGGNPTYIGQFQSIQDAERAAKEARAKYMPGSFEAWDENVN